MKHIKNYTAFNESMSFETELNELKFWDTIKSKIKGLFSSIEKGKTDQITKGALAFNKVKTKEERIKILTGMSASVKASYDEYMKDANNVLAVRKALKKVLAEVYGTLVVLANNTGVKEFAPSIIYDSGIVQFIGEVDPNKFDESIDGGINKFMTMVDEFPEDWIDSLKDNPDINKTEVKDDSDDKAIKYKENLTKQFDELVINRFNDKLTNVLKKGGVDLLNKNTLSAITNSMGSKNPKSEEKLVRYVTGLKEPKHLAAVRDTLIKHGVVTKEEGKNMQF